MVIAAVSQQTLVVPFLYGPILPHRSHFVVGLWWATGPTLPWYWLNFTPNYGVMVSHWIFWFLLELTTVNWNPFKRWFSEVAPLADVLISSLGTMAGVQKGGLWYLAVLYPTWLCLFVFVFFIKSSLVAGFELTFQRCNLKNCVKNFYLF